MNTNQRRYDGPRPLKDTSRAYLRTSALICGLPSLRVNFVSCPTKRELGDLVAGEVGLIRGWLLVFNL